MTLSSLLCLSLLQFFKIAHIFTIQCCLGIFDVFQMNSSSFPPLNLFIDISPMSENETLSEVNSFNLCHVEVKFYWQKTKDDIAIACREGIK